LESQEPSSHDLAYFIVLSLGVNFTDFFFANQKVAGRRTVFGEKIAIQFHQSLKLQTSSLN